MAIHRINIVSGIQPDGPINYLDCCSVCQTATVTFINDHNTTLNIIDFDLDLIGSGLASVTITAVNGLPPSVPIVIASGATFTMDLEICWDGVTSPLGNWLGKFITTEHGPELSWSFEMECVDWATVWTFPVIPFEFTDTPVGSSNSQSVSLYNPTIGPVSIALDFTGCGPTVVPIQTPTPAILPATGTGNVTAVWTPTDISDFISCSVEFCGVNFDVTGGAIAVPCLCLCCLDVEFQTDGGFLTPSNGFCNNEVAFDQSSFLDKKTIVYKMKAENPIYSGWRLQFNPSLFDDECTIPFDSGPLPVGYSITYASTLMVDGTAHQMTLFGALSNALNQKNWEVFFRPVNAATGEFNVELTMYMIQDFEQFVDSLTFDNSTKLKRNTLSNPNDYTNAFPSVYNTMKTAKGAFWVIDPAVLVNDSPFTCGTVACPNMTSRFYNLGLYNGPSEFTNPVFTLSRIIGNVTNFSTLENTRLQFKITVPAIYGASTPVIVFHLFDETIFDNTTDFLTSSDSSRYRVLGYGGTGVLDNHLVRPGTIANIGGDWVGSLYVDNTVTPSSKYRVAAIVYGSNGTMVNTFLSDEIKVKRTPDLNCDCTIDVDSGWNQYFQTTLADCFQPVGKERIGHRLNVTGGDFETCLTGWGFDFTEWSESLVGVRLNIYKRRENYPVVGRTTFFQYETHVSIRNNAFPGGFQNLNDLTVVDGLNVILTSINDRRVRYDNTLFSGGLVQTALSSEYMNRLNAGPLGSTYVSALAITDSWINNEVFFEYIFTFNFTNYLGTPFFWNIVKAYKVNAIGFEPINGGFEQRLLDVIIEGMDPVTGLFVPVEAPICFGDYLAIKLTYEADREGNFLFFIEPEPFGSSVLLENDEIPSPNQMTQLNSSLVLSQDTIFDPITFRASVILDAPNLANGKYLFCGYISSPEVPAICEYFLFHTKNGGSSLIVMPTPQVGDTINGTFNNVTAGRSLVCRLSNGSTVYPIPGTTYYFEYNFSVPTTRPLDFRFGTIATSGPIEQTLPIGSTSGSFNLVWGADTNGFWTMFTGAGTDMTGTFSFKIGNQLCP